MCETCINLYDDTMLFVDDIVCKFINRLETLNALENTIVILTSDHGEHFGEKNFYEHSSSLFNELIWIPLVVFYPSDFGLRGQNDNLVSLVDLFPTCLDLIDSPFPRPLNSRSILSPEKGDHIAAMNLFPLDQKKNLEKIFENGENINLETHAYCLILENNLKIIEKELGKVSIYDLGKDPSEDHDIARSLSEDEFQSLLALLSRDKEEKGYSGIPSALLHR